MSEVNPNEIPAILDALVGNIAPQADSGFDREAQNNIPRFESVCHWVWERLCVADRSYDSPYASAQQTARKTFSAAGDLALEWEQERERAKEKLEEA